MVYSKSCLMSTKFFSETFVWNTKRFTISLIYAMNINEINIMSKNIIFQQIWEILQVCEMTFHLDQSSHNMSPMNWQQIVFTQYFQPTNISNCRPLMLDFSLVHFWIRFLSLLLLLLARVPLNY